MSSPLPALSFAQNETRLREAAEQLLKLARERGASAAEASLSEQVGQAVSVRLAQVETIEYTRDRSAGLTVYLGQRRGEASTSDLSPDALARTVDAALAIAQHTAADDCAGLADAALLARAEQHRDLDAYHPWALPVEQAIGLAQNCEAHARAVDPRIRNSDGARVNTHLTQGVYANSLGFCGYERAGSHSLGCNVIAQENPGNEGMQSEGWYSNARTADALEDAETVGRKAGERALARLGAQRIPTGDYPVLYDAQLAGGLFAHAIRAVSGGSLYRRTSFLLDSLGQAVFAPCVDIQEDPWLPRGWGSCWFDGEGVATRPRPLVEAGVLQGYFLGSYAARKLGMPSTGNAGGSHNLIIAPTAPAAEGLAGMLKRLDRGLYITDLIGFGVNPVTGDYSRGASGFWVERGQIVHPVEEITIAGNLKEMYQRIVAIGADIDRRSKWQTGSVLIERMKVAGE